MSLPSTHFLFCKNKTDNKSERRSPKTNNTKTKQQTDDRPVTVTLMAVDRLMKILITLQVMTKILIINMPTTQTENY